MRNMKALDNMLAKRRLAQQLCPPKKRRAIRVRAGLSQADMALVVGVSAAAVSRWEAGNRTPQPGKTLERYIKALSFLAAGMQPTEKRASTT